MDNKRPYLVNEKNSVNNYKESIFTFKIINGNYNNWNKILYIGWCPNTFNSWNGDWFIKHINKKRNNPAQINIIEKYKKYYDLLSTHSLTKKYNIKSIHANIVNYNIKPNDYDLIIWWHGPEHVTKDQLNLCLNKFEIVKCDLILGGPLGHDTYHDPTSDDKHLCELSIDLFENRKYNYVVFDRIDRNQGPHISAWKLING